jgi:hypothetical protein
VTITVVSIRPIRDAERVDCPKCKEVAPWACRTKNYRSTQPHVARLDALAAARTSGTPLWSHG